MEAYPFKTQRVGLLAPGLRDVVRMNIADLLDIPINSVERFKAMTAGRD